MKKTYSEKLKDPRWQKKRLEILSRDNFTCQMCDDKESMLVIHHKIYESNDPWETCNEGLITLCQDCHESIHQNKSFHEKEFLNSFYKSGYLPHDLPAITTGFLESQNGDYESLKAIQWVLWDNNIKEMVLNEMKRTGKF